MELDVCIHDLGSLEEARALPAARRVPELLFQYTGPEATLVAFRVAEKLARCLRSQTSSNDLRLVVVAAIEVGCASSRLSRYNLAT
jgi:hypothetical protein